MADYFTKFSLVLKLKPEDQAYALEVATQARAHRWQEAPLPASFPPPLKEVLEDWNFETEQDKDGIWLNSDSGGINAVCNFIQHLLQRSDSKECVTFEWASDCSKPRPDAYGGGAALVTAQEITSLNTSEWLKAAVAESSRKESDPAEKRRVEIIELAREQNEIEGAVEIDDDAKLSEGKANGCYVQAWVWTDFADTQFDKEKESEAEAGVTQPATSN